MSRQGGHQRLQSQVRIEALRLEIPALFKIGKQIFNDRYFHAKLSSQTTPFAAFLDGHDAACSAGNLIMTTENVFKDRKDGILSALVDTTRTAGQISNEDLAFHRSSNPSVISLLEQQNIRLLQLARSLTWTAASGTEVSAPQFFDVDSLEDNWKGIVDVFDNLLEKADVCLDEYTGVIRRLSPTQEEKIKKAAPLAGKQRPGQAYRTQNIAKPQLLFAKVPTNDDSTPFKPLLRSKPHAVTPLEESLTLVRSEDGSTQYVLKFVSP